MVIDYKYDVDAVKRKRNARRYGLTDQEFAELETTAAGFCAICDETYPSLQIDHDHATGVVRGLLCQRCNSGLGMFQDNERLLLNAISYLKEVLP
jgi:hypothetical protein